MSASFDSKTIRFSNLYCPEYLAVYNAMTNKPSSTNAGYQNTMIKALVDGGYWTNRMELFYLFAQESTSESELKLNWKGPTGSFNLTDPGTVNPYEHAVQYQGIDGNGTDDYLSTNYNISTDAINVAQNSLTIGSWQLADTDNSDTTIGGNGANFIGVNIYPSDNSGDLNGRINSSSTDILIDTITSSTGLTIITRTAANEVKGYYNGSGGSTITRASTGLANVDLTVLAFNNNGTPAAYYDGIVSIVLLMNGISDDDALAIYNILNTYMTSIGN